MIRQIMKIATLLAIGLLMHASSAAQNDPINCTACGGGTTYGQYLTFGPSTNNLVLTGPGTHTINNSTGGYPLEHNLVGGFNNTLRDNSSTGAEGNFIHGEGNTITGTDGGVALGTNNSIDGSDLSYAFGDGNSITGGDGSTAFGEDITVNNDNAHGYGAGIDVSSQDAIVFGYGDLGSSTDLTDIGAKSITLGLDANNILNLKLNSSSNPVTGIGTGTSTPGSKLEIVGNGTTNSTSSLDVQDNNNNSLLFVRDDGFTGVQTTSPNGSWIFEVNGDAAKPGGGKWSNSSSDRRLKKNIKNYKDGLNKVMSIEPKWYQYKDKMGLPTEEKYVGVIAQQIKEIAPYMVEKSKKTGYYTFNGSSLTYMLINAIQEQQTQIQEEKAETQKMKKRLERQQKQIDQLKEKVNTLANQVNGTANRFENNNEETLNQKTVNIAKDDKAKQAMLLQNRPNPYANETIIAYYLPKEFESANLLITSTKGQMIKRISLKEPGKGELTLRTEGLNAGQYLYSLIIDGQKIQTRKMMINKK